MCRAGWERASGRTVAHTPAGISPASFLPLAKTCLPAVPMGGTFFSSWLGAVSADHRRRNTWPW